MKVLAAIPASNEADAIEQCVRNVSAFVALDHILVVDDGSTDDTGARAQATGARVIAHSHNMGKGAAILTALSFAEQNRFDWIVFMDGDGQHPADRLPAFLRAIGEDRADLLIGNRRQRAARMPRHRQLSNGITSLMVSLWAGRRIHDSQCGMRAVSVSALRGIRLAERGFQLESEMLIKLIRRNVRVAEIDIETIYGNEKSSIRLAADTLKFMRLLLKCLW